MKPSLSLEKNRENKTNKSRSCQKWKFLLLRRVDQIRIEDHHLYSTCSIEEIFIIEIEKSKVTKKTSILKIKQKNVSVIIFTSSLA